MSAGLRLPQHASIAASWPPGSKQAAREDSIAASWPPGSKQAAREEK
jgi:hypothetical protein